MDQIAADPLGEDQERYRQLDRMLLYLLTGELGYFILLVVGGIVFSILVSFLDVFPAFFRPGIVLYIPVLILLLALLANMAGGLASLILHLRIGHQGYPGTGHLLNWILLMTTGWLFILASVTLLPSLVSFGFD